MIEYKVNKYRVNLTMEELQMLTDLITEKSKNDKSVEVQMLYRKMYAKLTICKTLEDR